MITRAPPRLVPELLVTDIATSLAFWRDVLGFRTLWERSEQGFAYLDRDGAEIMLDQIDPSITDSPWITGSMQRPFGRGINLEIQIDELDTEITRLLAAGVPFRLPPEEKWYRTGAVETGVRQLMILDPDGYLVRLQQVLGNRPVT
jgi:catechol 2,3-dioxygenase-like lactoylglutathione lyase family enzyme